MKKVEVELLTSQSNYAVVRLPKRKFPGVVVQGDSLSILVTDADEIFELAKKYNDAELSETIELFLSKLVSIQCSYETALDSAGIELPYYKRSVNQESNAKS